MPIRRALLSFQDPGGAASLASALIDIRIEVLATRETAAAIRAAGLAVTEIEACAGTSGRIDALNPHIHAALLAHRAIDPAPDDAEAEVNRIDFVAVSLRSPPEAASFDDLLGGLALGGPALARTAAASFAHVTILVDEGDWARVVREIYREGGDTTPATRRALALKAIHRVARHDGEIAERLASFDLHAGRRRFPALVHLQAQAIAPLSSGENPHQVAMLYREEEPPPGTIPGALYVGASSRTASFHELLDASMAIEAVAEHDGPTALLAVRQKPVAVAGAATLDASLRAVARAHDGSFAGGVLALNRAVDEATAIAARELPVSALVAPTFELAAMDALEARRDLVLLAVRRLPAPDRLARRWLQIAGGILVEESDATARGEVERGRVVSSRYPTAADLRAMTLAWAVCKHARSDAAVLAREDPEGLFRTIGVGAGCASLVEALEVAIARAGAPAQGAVLACDGPVVSPQVIELAMRAGVVGIVQSGGVTADAECAAVADRASMVMVMTGVSHLRSW